ncbi:MAG: hypothetical protein RLZ47_690 [Bacteroidota bacterium]|jgi:hypothetical protein
MKKQAKHLLPEPTEKFDRLLLQLLSEDLRNLKFRRSSGIPVYYFSHGYNLNKGD